MTIELSVYETTFALTNGDTRQALFLAHKDRITEISPLSGWSTETFEDAKAQLLTLFEKNLTSPLLPSVEFGLRSLLIKRHSLASIPLCGLLSSPEELAQKPHYTCYKLKLGDLTFTEAVAFVEQVHEHSGKPVRVDFNQKWQLDSILSFLHHVPPSMIEYVEEPLDTLTPLLDKTQHTFALDESLRTLPWEDLAELAPHVVFVLKPTLLGNVEPLLDLSPKKAVLSSAYETGFGTRYLLNLYREYPSLANPVGCGTYTYLDRDPAFPECELSTSVTGVLTWNVQFERPLQCIRTGQLILPDQLASPIELSTAP